MSVQVAAISAYSRWQSGDLGGYLAPAACYDLDRSVVAYMNMSTPDHARDALRALEAARGSEARRMQIAKIAAEGREVLRLHPGAWWLVCGAPRGKWPLPVPEIRDDTKADAGTVASGPATTADITAAGSYDVSIGPGETYAVGGGTLDGATATLTIDYSAELDLSGGVLAQQAGTLALEGTLADGTLDLAGGSVFDGAGTLAGMTVIGALTVAAYGDALSISNGIAIRGTAAGQQGTIDVTEGSINFRDSETLTDALLTFGTATGEYDFGGFNVAGTLALDAREHAGRDRPAQFRPDLCRARRRDRQCRPVRAHRHERHRRCDTGRLRQHRHAGARHLGHAFPGDHGRQRRPRVT